MVRVDIIIIGQQATQVPFKNCTPFTKSIRKINKTTIDDAENLYLVMQVYNVIGYSSKLFWNNRNFMVLFKRWNNWF